MRFGFIIASLTVSSQALAATGFVTVNGVQCSTDCYKTTRICVPKPWPLHGKICTPEPIRETACRVKQVPACDLDSLIMTAAVGAATTTPPTKEQSKPAWIEACSGLAVIEFLAALGYYVSKNPGNGIIVASLNLWDASVATGYMTLGCAAIYAAAERNW